MSGDELLLKLKHFGYTKRSEIAELLGITEQNFNIKIKAKDIKVSFLQDIAKSINKSIYDFFDNEIAIVEKTNYTSHQENKYLIDLIELQKEKIKNLEAEILRLKTFQKTISKQHKL